MTITSFTWHESLKTGNFVFLSCLIPALWDQLSKNSLFLWARFCVTISRDWPLMTFFCITDIVRGNRTSLRSEHDHMMAWVSTEKLKNHYIYDYYRYKLLLSIVRISLKIRLQTNLLTLITFLIFFKRSCGCARAQNFNT